jgi:septum formation protein
MNQEQETPAATTVDDTTDSSAATTTTTAVARPELVLAWREYLQQSTDDVMLDTDSKDNSFVSEETFSTPIKIRLILASQSPRRCEILESMGLAKRFVVVPSPLDEAALARQLLTSAAACTENLSKTTGESAATSASAYTRVLAERKALSLAEQMARKDESVASRVAPSATTIATTLILGSDTIVALRNGTILEKPKSPNEAISMLQQLQGTSHVVHTSVALVQLQQKRHAASSSKDIAANDFSLLNSWTETATVHMAPLSRADIAAYVATGEPMDKAGSYGIQGYGGQMVSSIDGDFFTVCGVISNSQAVQCARLWWSLNAHLSTLSL